MEQLITTSPTCLNKSIHKSRLQRKRKRQQNTQQNSSSIQAINFYKSSSAEDSSDNDTTSCTKPQSKCSNIIPNFKPFLDEIKLCIADRVPMETKNKPAFGLTQQFQTCQDMFTAELEQNQNEAFGKETVQPNIAANLLNNCSMITESELVKCWNQIDHILVENSSHLKETAASKILKDFGLSPLCDKQMQNSSNVCELTPEFRLKRLPLRSYSRRKVERACRRLKLEPNHSSNKHLDTIDVEDKASVCSSSLSVEEDLTQIDEKQENLNLSPNESQILCNNLLNLTAFFSIESHAAALNDDDVMPTSQIIPDLIQDILSYQSRSQRADSFSSSEDFQGFNNVDNEKQSISLEEDMQQDNALDGTVLNAAQLMEEAERNRIPTPTGNLGN